MNLIERMRARKCLSFPLLLFIYNDKRSDTELLLPLDCIKIQQCRNCNNNDTVFFTIKLQALRHPKNFCNSNVKQFRCGPRSNNDRTKLNALRRSFFSKHLAKFQKCRLSADCSRTSNFGRLPSLRQQPIDITLPRRNP